jgi:hypothetical protein
LLACYPSQLDEGDVLAVAEHATRVSGERVWVHPQRAHRFPHLDIG